eukprot:GEMP01010297.1.p1 GENE.GEMP01010297.1~~GEMP01010297.1.p1  ORF type:complete len:575 (+),score=145.37 GEMP01010297.1:156-1880(+)
MDALSQAKPSRPPDHSREHSRPRGDSERASRHERPPDPRDDRNDTAQVEPQELIRKVFSRRRGVSGHTASSRRQGPRTLKSEHNDTNALSTEPPKTVIAPPRVSPPPPALVPTTPPLPPPPKRNPVPRTVIAPSTCAQSGACWSARRESHISTSAQSGAGWSARRESHISTSAPLRRMCLRAGEENAHGVARRSSSFPVSSNDVPELTAKAPPESAGGSMRRPSWGGWTAGAMQWQLLKVSSVQQNSANGGDNSRAASARNSLRSCLKSPRKGEVEARSDSFAKPTARFDLNGNLFCKMRFVLAGNVPQSIQQHITRLGGEIQDYPNRQQPGKRMFPQGGATHILIASDCPTAEAAKKVTLLRNATPLSADYIHECVEKETSLDEEAFWPHQLPASSKTTPSAPSSPYQRTPRRLSSSLAVSNVRTGGMPDSANQRAHKEEMGVNSTLFSGLRFCAIGALPEGRFADLVSRGGEMLPQFGSPRVTHYIVSEVYAWERSRRKPLGRPVINLSWVDACIRKDRIISTPSRDAAPSSSSSRVSRQPHTRSHMEHNYALLDQPASALLGSNVRNFACI